MLKNAQFAIETTNPQRFLYNLCRMIMFAVKINTTIETRMGLVQFQEHENIIISSLIML